MVVCIKRKDNVVVAGNSADANPEGAIKLL